MILSKDFVLQIQGMAKAIGRPCSKADVIRMAANDMDADRIALEKAFGGVFDDNDLSVDWKRWHEPGFRTPRRVARLSNPVVGVFHTVFNKTGGTETWGLHFSRVMKRHVKVAGVAFHGGEWDGESAVPMRGGLDAIIALASVCDIAICWGLSPEAMRRVRDNIQIGGRVVHTHHGDLSSEWSVNVIRENWRQGDEIVAVHPVVARKLGATYIANGIDPTRLPTQVRSMRESPVVLWMHRFSLEKYPMLSAEACKLCPADWRFIFAGNPSACWDETMAVVAGDPRFEFVANGDPKDLLSRSNLFLSLSDMEGFGYSTVEAAGAGLRVVASPVGVAMDRHLVHQIPASDRSPEGVARHLIAALTEVVKAADAKKHAMLAYGEQTFAENWKKLLLGKPKPVPIPA